jgi:predicted MPP superfamily phosphohydrolase
MPTNHGNNKSGSTKPHDCDWIITRRVFLKASAGTLGSLALAPLSCAPQLVCCAKRPTAKFGIVTDTHYADTDNVGTRFYRHSLDKLTECVELMNAKKVDFLIELGDFKDQNNPPVEQKTISYLMAVEKVFQRFNGPTYHVLGNHDEDSISKSQFLANIKNTNIDSWCSYYSFDLKGLHFVVLDANYTTDGSNYNHSNFDWTDANIAPDELDWLRHDLAAARGPVIAFIHQPLDGTGPHYVKNAADVRQVLQESGKVLAVFQGHYHQGSYSLIESIHYYTLKATVEGPGPQDNSYAVVEVMPDSTITVTGYRKAVSKHLTPAAQL